MQAIRNQTAEPCGARLANGDCSGWSTPDLRSPLLLGHWLCLLLMDTSRFNAPPACPPPLLSPALFLPPSIHCHVSLQNIFPDVLAVGQP